MESEITLKSIDWKEGKNAKGWPWKMLMLRDAGDMVYSAFSNQIPGETLELVNRLKPGDALKIDYEMAKTKDGKDVRNLKGIIEHEPAQDAPAKPTNSDGKMTKEDWAAKDRRIARESCLASASRALQGSSGLIARDVVEMAKVFESYVYGEDNDKGNQDSPDSNGSG